MRAAIPTLLVALAFGCMPPESGHAGGAAMELTLRPVEVDGGWLLELENGSDDLVELGCRATYCEVPTVRVEAQQADGTWVERASGLRWARQLGELVRIPPGGSFVLGEGQDDLGDLEAGPGTYRAVVHTRDAGEVALEYVVVGWSPETTRSAHAIRARAEEAGCGELLTRCGGGPGVIDEALFGHVEPDALIDMHESAPNERQPPIREAMLDRGGFVVFLQELLSVGPMSTVRELAEWLGRWPDEAQQPLRRSAAQRLTEPLAGHMPVSAEDYGLIHQLDEYWPEGTAEHIVARLERGPEEGEALIALLRLLAESWGGTFDDHGPRILVALPGRCDGATSAVLIETCEQVELVYGPDQNIHFGGLGLHGVGCGGCGGVGSTEACDAVWRDWQALEANTDELEIIWLGR